MKNIAAGFLIAFSMYSRIPMIQTEWTKERMRYALCFFPLIGAIIGGAEILLFLLITHAGGGTILWTGLGTALPILITGGIHLDGYLDTADALNSYGDREKRLNILKDPHIGAFAAISLGTFLLLYCGGLSQLGKREVICLAAVFLMERALSGLSFVTFPMAKKDGLAAQFSGAAVKRTVRIVMALYLAAGAVFLLRFGSGSGILVLLTLAVSFGLYGRRSVKIFGGTTGDLAGHFLEVTECACVLMLAACRLAGI